MDMQYFLAKQDGPLSNSIDNKPVKMSIIALNV